MESINYDDGCDCYCDADEKAAEDMAWCMNSVCQLQDDMRFLKYKVNKRLDDIESDESPHLPPPNRGEIVRKGG